MTINQGKPCHSSNYSSRGGSSIKYIVIHYTANNGDTAQNNCSYFSGAGRNASAHYFVGDDGIYRSVPDAYKAWHCGGTSYYKHPYCRNANSIGIEMCSRIDSSGHYYIRDGIVSQTIELTRYLMDKYGIESLDTFDGAEEYMQAIVDNEPSMIPLDVGSDYDRRFVFDLSWGVESNAKGDARYAVLSPTHLLNCVSENDPTPCCFWTKGAAICIRCSIS